MATFTKLCNGSWGLVGTSSEMIQGNRVRVDTRSGRVVYKIVGRVLWRGDGRAISESIDIADYNAEQVASTNGNHQQVNQHSPSISTAPSVASTPTQGQKATTPASTAQNVVQSVVAAVNGMSVPASQSVYEPSELPRPDHTIKDGPPAPVMTPEELEAQVRRMGELVMIDYDIIEDRPHIDPCPYLYAAGFYRSSKSCWVGEKSRIPWRLLHRMEELGHTWDYTGLKSDETARKIQQAVVKITEEIRSLQASIEKTVETAQKNLEQASETNEDGTHYATLKAQEKHRKTVDAAIKKCQDRLERFMVAARAFGIANVVMGERRRMAGVVSGMKKVAQDRVQAWFSLTQKAQGTPLHSQIESGEMPPEVAMDYLTDEGIDVEDERNNF